MMPGAQILIVDDDPWIVRMVTTVLEKRGHVIHAASDGEEGLQKALKLHPDLVITDVMMPKMDGWTLVRTLRSRAELALTPVIFLTALGGDEERIRGFRLGADDYLPKPFRFEELDLRVANALKKRRALEQQAQTLSTAEPQHTAGAAPGRPTGIHGTLDQLGLSSLLAMIDMERKSGILVLTRGRAVGRIFCRQGRVLSARLEGEGPFLRKGPEVIYQMLTWTDGRFDFMAVEVEMEDEIRTQTMHLLMEGARRIDEARAAQA
ncbi:MAG: response regulator [Myxococcales bacterium]|nr:response regulator [Myxococcota bacterium]MDW8282297.1 response regulator [Myxococcales bacterium]